MDTPLLIYGAGGLGREVLSLVKAIENIQVIGFLDDKVTKNTLVKGIKVLGGQEVINGFDRPVNVVLAFGNPVAKARKVTSIEQLRVQYLTLIHPSVVLQDEGSIRIGEGSILCAGCKLTTDIVVGSHVLINLNCSVGHDTGIGNFSSIMPGVNIAGEVVIGEEVMIGAGTSILNRITIGKRCQIGMGSAVIRNVEDDMLVAGVPAKVVATRSESKQQS